MKITKCDVCKQELTRNMVDAPLVISSGQFKAQVSVARVDDNGIEKLDGDLCHDCLMKMLTSTPRKPRSDKGKTHQNRQTETDAAITSAAMPLPKGATINLKERT